MTITASNDTPTLDDISDPATILPNAGQQSVALSGITAGGGESQPLTVTTLSLNTDLIPNATDSLDVTYNSPDSTGTLLYTPAADATGTAQVSVTVSDGSDSVTKSFNVRVYPALAVKTDTGEDATSTTLSSADAAWTVTLSGGSGSGYTATASKGAMSYSSGDDAQAVVTISNGTLTFRAPTTGAFAGSWTVMITDSTSNQSVVYQLTVPIKLRILRVSDGESTRALLSNDSTSGSGLHVKAVAYGAGLTDTITFAALDANASDSVSVINFHDATDNSATTSTDTVTADGSDNVAVLYLGPTGVMEDIEFTVKATHTTIGSTISPLLKVYKVTDVTFTVSADSRADMTGAQMEMEAGPARDLVRALGVTDTATFGNDDTATLSLTTPPGQGFIFRVWFDGTDTNGNRYDQTTITLSSLADTAVELKRILSPLTFSGTVTVPAGSNSDARVALHGTVGGAAAERSAVMSPIDDATDNLATYAVTIARAGDALFTPTALVAYGDGLIASQSTDVTVAEASDTHTVDFTLQAVPAAVVLSSAGKQAVDTLEATLRDSTETLTSDVDTTGKEKGEVAKQGLATITSAATLKTALTTVTSSFGGDAANTDVVVRVGEGGTVDTDAPITLIVRDASGTIKAAPVLFKALDDASGTRKATTTETKPAEVGKSQNFAMTEMGTVSEVKLTLPTNAFKENTGAVFASVRAATVKPGSTGEAKAALTGGELVEIDLAVLSSDGADVLATSSDAADNVVSEIQLSLPVSTTADADFDTPTELANGFSNGTLAVYTAPTIQAFEAGNTTIVSGATYNELTGQVEFTVNHFSAFGVGEVVSTPPAAGGGGCFIATAAYGSYEAPYVELLREFRDQYLLTNEPGQWFVEQYYSYSPPIADWIRDREAVKSAVRVLLLPLIGFALLLFQMGPVLALLLLAGSIVGLGWLVVRTRNRIKTT